MAIRNVPNLPAKIAEELLLAEQKRNIRERAMGLCLHRDYCDENTQILAETSPADLPAVIVRANALRTLYIAHIASTALHIAADATNTISAAVATDQSSVNTLLNEIKTDLNAHQILAAAHDVGPADGAVGAAPQAEATTNASDLATSQALCASLCAMWNRHVRSGAPTLALVAS